MMSSRVTRLGASLVLGLMLTAGLASPALGAGPTDPTAKPSLSPTVGATQADPGSSGYHISGTVTGTGGALLQSVSVTLESSAFTTSASTLADGTYSAPVMPGTYKLYFTGSASSYLHGYYASGASGHFDIAYSAATPVTVVSADVTGKDVQLGTGHTISGTVTGTGSAPLSSVHVQAYSAAYNGNLSTAVDGTYTIMVPGSASYTLYFTDPYGLYLPGLYNSAASGHITSTRTLPARASRWWRRRHGR